MLKEIGDKNAIENQKWLNTPSTFTKLKTKKELIFFFGMHL
jgi:hypothetical protein